MSKPSDRQYKTVATVLIHNADRMTYENRKVLANWLRTQAKGLEVDGGLYAPRFRARFFNPKREE